MRDYDVERHQRAQEREKELGDRSFKLGGEVFTYKANVSYDVLRQLTSDTQLVGGAYIDAIEQSCLQMIEDTNGQHQRFLDLSKRSDDPITLQDLQSVFAGLVEDAFRRPTQASLPSGDTDANTGETSTGTSSTGPAVASAA